MKDKDLQTKLFKEIKKYFKKDEDFEAMMILCEFNKDTILMDSTKDEDGMQLSVSDMCELINYFENKYNVELNDSPWAYFRVKNFIDVLIKKIKS